MRIIFGFYSKRFALKGLGNARAIGSNQSSARLSPYLVAPSGLIRVGTRPLNPGATLFRPLRATDWPYDEAKFSDVTFYKCPKCAIRFKSVHDLMALLSCKRLPILESVQPA